MNLDKIFVVLNSPVIILVVVIAALLIFLRGTRIDFPTFIAALNSINSQPFALMVLGIGFWMLVECKKWGIDTTIAGGVIGCGVNMLQAQLKDATHPPPGGTLKIEATSGKDTTPSKEDSK